MLTKAPSLRSPAALPADHAAWHLFAPGDEVSILGTGAYEIVHLSHGRAWLSAVATGTQRLADISALRLRQSGMVLSRQN